ncbi:MAG TPA: DUF6677 family protein [bacterium]
MNKVLYMLLGFVFPGAVFFAKKKFFKGIWVLTFTALPFFLGVLLLQSADPSNTGFLNWFRSMLGTNIDASGAITYAILSVLRLIFIIYPFITSVGFFAMGIVIDHMNIGIDLSNTLYMEIGTCYCIVASLLNMLVLLSSYDLLRENE